jgi:hypothetical protein
MTDDQLDEFIKRAESLGSTIGPLDDFCEEAKVIAEELQAWRKLHAGK